jgi:lipid-A-disaccharide synthase
MEVRLLLPEMLAAASQLMQSKTVDEAVLIEAPGVSETVDQVCLEHPQLASTLERATGPARRHELAGSSVAWTASGTATLECALLDVPMIVGYRLHPVTYQLARLLVRVPHVALANLIAEERAAPELIQNEWTAQSLIEATERLLAGQGEAQRQRLATIRRRLGSPGASDRAARAVLEHMRSG